MKKELLTKLKEVFAPTDIPMPKPEVELTEKIKETEVVQEKVELADEPKEEKEAPAQEEVKVEYATKLELQELQRTFMDLLEAMQKTSEVKQEVPQELSAEAKEEVELAEEVEEIPHNPEEAVAKVENFSPVKSNPNSLKSRIYNQLFN